MLELSVAKNWLLVSGDISGRGVTSSIHSYADVLATTPGGLKPLNNFNLLLVAGYSEVVKGGKEARSLVNCFEFEQGAPNIEEKVGSLLGKRRLQVGSALVKKKLIILRSWNRILEEIRVDMDRVISSSKSFRGFTLRAGFNLKKVRPLMLEPDPKPSSHSDLVSSWAGLPDKVVEGLGDDFVSGSEVGRGIASPELALAVGQGGLLKCVEPVSDMPGLSLSYPGVSDG